MKTVRFAALLAVVMSVVGASNDLSATSLLPCPNMKDLAGVWLAHSNEGIESARLELNEKGGGTLIVNFSPPTTAFRVSSVHLDGYQISFVLVPIDRDPDGLRLSGTASSFQLDLELRGTAGTARGVVSHLRFERYDRVIKAIQVLDARAAALKARGK